MNIQTAVRAAASQIQTALDARPNRCDNALNGRSIHPQRLLTAPAIRIYAAAKAETSDSHISATPAVIQCQIVLAACTSTRQTAMIGPVTRCHSAATAPAMPAAIRCAQRLNNVQARDSRSASQVAAVLAPSQTRVATTEIPRPAAHRPPHKRSSPFHTARIGITIGKATTKRRAFVCHSVADRLLRPGARTVCPSP